MFKPKAIILNPGDNAATAPADLKVGETLPLGAGKKTLAVKLTAPVPFGRESTR